MVQIDGQVVIDLAVIMPSHLFQEKDYINYRYFHKRAFYLACIAAGILETKEGGFFVEFDLQSDNLLQPVIIVGAGPGADNLEKSNCKIRIILAADKYLFPISKTLPTKNAVRFKIGEKSDDNSPTPFYNATIRSECASVPYLKFLHATSIRSESFIGACILGSIWLRQRSLRRGGFGPFEWACTLALLLQGGGHGGKPVLSNGYSSIQLFKATVQFLAVIDLIRYPVSIQATSIKIVNSHQPMLFDGVRGLNVLFKMTPWSYGLLKHEALCTSKVLSDQSSDHFDACFITRLQNSLFRFDSVIILSTPHPPLPNRSQEAAISDRMACCHDLYQILTKGLGDRSLLINLDPRPSPTWLPGLQMPKEKTEDDVTIGLLLNPEQVGRTIDRGPSAEDKEAAATFRRFWGEKAELRRFKDGNIQESLIWSTHVSSNTILRQIITYCIRRHIGDEVANSLKFVGDSLGHKLSPHPGYTSNFLTSYHPILEAFQGLENDIRGLEGLPLHVRQISAADPQLRFASVQVPIPGTVSRNEPASICVQFEGSSRWPDDIAAVRRTKIAFLLKIGELLKEQNRRLIARVGLENTNNRLLETAFLDILYPSGALFRVRIHHERELNLLERTLKGEVQTVVGREEAALALSAYKRHFIQAPLHTQAVHTLSTRFPILSSSMRLMKTWRDSHLLSGHISDELIELLTICTFVNPYPWSVPGSVMTGFLRTLTLVARWDWRSEPLIVDFNGEMKSQDIDNINLRYEAWRKIDPAMNRVAMFLASNVDQSGIAWTESGPSKVVAARFTSLAKAACDLVVEQEMKLKLEELFLPSTVEYDFVIHLDPRFVEEGPKAGGTLSAPFKNLQIQASEDRTLVGVNPMQSFLDELRALYGSNVLFFYGESGGQVIGGLWNPQTGPRPWKINWQYSTLPHLRPGSDAHEPQVTLNRRSTLNDISRLGYDLILWIDTGKGNGVTNNV